MGHRPNRQRMLMSRIAGLLGSPSLAPTKLDQLKIKANILSSFAKTKVEQAYDTAKDVAGNAAGVMGDAMGGAKDQVVEGADAFVKMMEDTANKVKEEL